MIRVIEENRVHDFYYRRYEIESAALGRTNTFGVLQAFPFDEPGFLSELSITFIHGGDGDDRQFVAADLLSSLQPLQREKLLRLKAQIILPSIGLTFLKSPLDEHLLKEIYPAAKLAPAAPKAILGISMGGTAVFSLNLRYPGFFRAVAAHFPGFIDFNPFENSAALEYQKQTGISDEKRGVLQWCYQQGFRNLEEFEAYDPLRLFSQHVDGKAPLQSIYLDCGTKDDFGLWRGAKIWSTLLNEAKIPNELSIVQGGEHDLPFLQARLSYSFASILNNFE